MTDKQSIALLRTAKSVEDWNRKREKVVNETTLEQWEDSLRHQVDGAGLIVEVLGRDVPRQRWVPQELLSQESNSK